jgi:hypothetical protein
MRIAKNLPGSKILWCDERCTYRGLAIWKPLNPSRSFVCLYGRGVADRGYCRTRNQIFGPDLSFDVAWFSLAYTDANVYNQWSRRHGEIGGG